MQNVEQAEDTEVLRKFTRELAVVLNDHELQSYGKMLAEKCKEQELALERKKQMTSEENAKIKTITNDIKRIADARAKGEELRPVRCYERIRGNVIEIVREDRGIVVDTRPAELRDLQTSIPGTKPDDFDEGRCGDDIGSNGVSNDEDPAGEMHTSSVGDEVYHQPDGPGDDDGELDENVAEIHKRERSRKANAAKGVASKPKLKR